MKNGSYSSLLDSKHQHECFPCDWTSWSDYMNNLLFVCLFSIKAAYFHTAFLECLITAPNTCMESGRPPPSRRSLGVWPGFDFTIRERSGSPCWLFRFCYGIIECCSIEITGSMGNFSVIWGIARAGLVIMVTLSCPARDLHGNDQLHDNISQALVWRDISDCRRRANFAGISAFKQTDSSLVYLPSAVIWRRMPLGYTRQTIFG